MKYCLSSRQGKEFLSCADEIMVQSKDYLTLFDLLEKFPQKTFILRVELDSNIDWNIIRGCNKNGNLICCLENLQDIEKCRIYGVPFYYAYQVNSFFELQGLKDLGVVYAYIGMPLFFQMDEVKKVGIPLRAIPNLAYDAYIPHMNGICGQWIRPEDMDIYEEYFSACEFKTTSEEKERALFRIYAQDKKWPGDLSTLISNLNVSCNNNVVYKDLVEKRLNCGQVCQQRGSCHYCERALTFDQTVIEYKESKSK